MYSLFKNVFKRYLLLVLLLLANIVVTYAAGDRITFTWYAAAGDEKEFAIYATVGEVFTVSWGDTAASTPHNDGYGGGEFLSHVYSTTGNYTVTIEVQSSECYLKGLELENMSVTALDVHRAPHLTRLDCAGNWMESLDVDAVRGLKVLYCFNNPMVKLRLGTNESLNKLYCFGCWIDTLDVSGCPVLTYLDCSENALRSLNIKGAKSLSRLDCSGGWLTSLDASGSDKLSFINCSSNYLAALNVQGDTSLYRIECSDNQLTNIDVSTNKNLLELNCSNNRLTSLNVRGAEKLMLLYCHNNRLSLSDMYAASQVVDNIEGKEFGPQLHDMQHALLDVPVRPTVSMQLGKIPTKFVVKKGNVLAKEGRDYQLVQGEIIFRTQGVYAVEMSSGAIAAADWLPTKEVMRYEVVSAELASHILYVKSAGKDNADGKSWATAKRTLQAAMSAAVAGDTVCVAAGTYYGGFFMKEGVQVFGGFNTTQPEGIAERNLQQNVTVLNGEKRRRVITQPRNFADVTAWDGFVLQGGRASVGAAAYLMEGGMLRRCSFADNVSGTPTVGEFQPQYGGVVYHVANGKAHVMALCDAGDGLLYPYDNGWGGVVQELTLTKANTCDEVTSTLSTGAINTVLLARQNSRAAMAAQTYSQRAYGFTDPPSGWYLPSAAEWRLFVNSCTADIVSHAPLFDVVNETLTASGGVQLDTLEYYSSTLHDNLEPWVVNFLPDSGFYKHVAPTYDDDRCMYTPMKVRPVTLLDVASSPSILSERRNGLFYVNESQIVD